MRFRSPQPRHEPPRKPRGFAAPLAPLHRSRWSVFRLAPSAPVYVIAGFTIFLLALLWSALAYQLSGDKAAVLEAARSNSDNLARAYAEHVLGALRLADQELLHIKEDYEKSGALPDFVPGREDSLAGAATLLLAVTDAQGRITASSVDLPPGARDTADRAYFRVHIGSDSGELYISEPLQGRATGKQVIALSRRLNKPDGNFAGIVFGSFDPEYLSSFFRDFAVGKNSSSAIIGRDMIVRDMIRGAGRATGAIGKSVANSKLAPALARAANGSYVDIGEFDGIARLYSYRSLPDYPLIVRASVAEVDVLANFNQRKSRLLGVAAALSLVFVAVAAFQLRQLTIQAKAAGVLRQTQELLNESQRVAKLGYVFRDVPNDRVHWSDSMYELRGVPRDETITRDKVAKLIEPEDHARYRAMRAEAFPQRHGFEIEMRMRMPDGSRRWEHRVVHPRFDAHGELVAVLIVVQDITEQKKAALALQRSRELLARAQHIANLGSFERDLVTGEIHRSEEFYRLWGIAETNTDISAEQLVLLIHPEDRQRFLDAREAALVNASAAPIDYRIIRPDGAERVLHSEYGADFDENGEPVRLYGIIQDISERKKIELELRHSRENLVRAQRIARIGSFERDFATGNVEWSDEMYHILGLEKASAPPGAETLIRLVHPEDRETFMAYRDGEISGQPLTSIEYRILRPDGEERVVQRESDMLFDEQGRPVRRSGTLQDITERRVAERRERELERKLLHSQKLEALGTLAGGIAHDLNNTLVPLMALSKVAARELASGNPLRAKLDTIFAASEQARDLVKRVLAFSRRDQIEKRPANLQAIVTEALALMRATLPTSIVLDARIGRVPVIDADASQIHQVVTNLVTNAAQAIGPGLGTITVTLALIPERADRGTIHLSVADTGAGMDEATRQRIFEPFFTTKHVGQGTGLGLSIVESIVTDHGGRIELTSAPGKGARFDIYFLVPGVRASAA